MRVLDGVNARSLAGFGWESFAWVRWGGRGRGCGTPGRVLLRRFRRTTRVPNIPGCILYVDQWGFRFSMSSDHREGGPRSSIALGRTCAVQASTTRRPIHGLKTVKGLLLLVPSRIPRSSGYDVYAHAVITYHWKVVVGPGAQLCTLLEVWVLGVGMSTLDAQTVCTPRIGDSQVPMTLEHDPVTSNNKTAPGPDPRIRHRIQIGMFRPIRVDHTNCLQVAIKTHSFKH
jgi:hypothetical protein